MVVVVVVVVVSVVGWAHAASPSPHVRGLCPPSTPHSPCQDPPVPQQLISPLFITPHLGHLSCVVVVGVVTVVVTVVVVVVIVLVIVLLVVVLVVVVVVLAVVVVVVVVVEAMSVLVMARINA